MSLMAYNLWASFEVSDSEVDALFKSSDRLPTWLELKPSSPVTEEMFGDVVKVVPSWWSLANKTQAIAAERLTTKGKVPISTRMCAINLGDGFWRIYIKYNED